MALGRPLSPHSPLRQSSHFSNVRGCLYQPHPEGSSSSSLPTLTDHSWMPRHIPGRPRALPWASFAPKGFRSSSYPAKQGRKLTLSESSWRTPPHSSPKMAAPSSFPGIISQPCRKAPGHETDCWSSNWALPMPRFVTPSGKSNRPSALASEDSEICHGRKWRLEPVWRWPMPNSRWTGNTMSRS